MSDDRDIFFMKLMLVLLLGLLAVTMLLYSAEQTKLRLTREEYAYTDIVMNGLKEQNRDLEAALDTLTLTRRPEFLRIAEQVANSQKYKRGVYDCTNFTDDAVNELREAGYHARRFQVKKKGSSVKHAITEITLFVESQTGRIILPGRYEEYGIDEVS